MARGDVTFFEEALEHIGDGTIDMDTDTFNLAICDNTVAPTAGTANPDISLFTQVGAAGSYTTGGTALTTTWVEAAGTVTFDSSTNPSWAQNASNDTDAYWGIVYSTTATATDAICFLDLGGPVDMSAGDLTVTWNASGIFTIS